jgi:hypothetical protein
MLSADVALFCLLDVRFGRTAATSPPAWGVRINRQLAIQQLTRSPDEESDTWRYVSLI